MSQVNHGQILGISFAKVELLTMLDIPYFHWRTKAFELFRKSTQGRYSTDEIIKIHKLYQTFIHDYMEELAASVSVIQAKQTLDIPKNLVIKLYRLGHLRKLQSQSLIPTRISQDSLKIIHDKYISIWAISKLLQLRIASIQKAVIESGASYLAHPGEHTPYLIERNSLPILREHLTQVKLHPEPSSLRLDDNLRISTIDTNQKTQLITFKQACKRLGCRKVDMHLLANSGVFTTYGRRNLRLLKSADISSFKRKFITLSSLKKATGIHGNQIIEVLSEMGILSATFRAGDFSTTIVKKSDIKKTNFQIPYEYASTLTTYRKNGKSITFNKAQKELGIGRHEFSKLARDIIYRRPIVYQSTYYRRGFSFGEFEEIKKTFLESVPLDAIIKECGIPKSQILSQFKIIRNKEILHLNKIANLRKSFAADIFFYYTNYISINAAASSINISPPYLLKILSQHPDPNPYLKSTPSFKCLSAGHFDFAFKLARNLPENFSGPVKPT
ncbi:hypothetical protein [Pseudomonas sp. B22(2017)]|uniref:hypothetical protein n=1 Tax=Pseudomonas sp. B22(2017) TaxID=1981736 RepID=UPI00117AC486|nr:hypothetical protein [Pseudomonas sp. B22(2017)]